MADKWTVIAGDKETITIVINIATVDYEVVIGIGSLESSTVIGLEAALRAFAVTYRNQVLTAITPTIIVDTVVGFTEDF